MNDILENAWFQQDLPPGTLEMNRVYLQQPVDNAVRPHVFSCIFQAFIGWLLVYLMAVRGSPRAAPLQNFLPTGVEES